MTEEIDPVQAIAVIREVIGELAVSSPKTLRELAAELISAQHPACARLVNRCDPCHVRFNVGRMLHVVATTTEQGHPFRRSEKPS